MEETCAKSRAILNTGLFMYIVRVIKRLIEVKLNITAIWGFRYCLLVLLFSIIYQVSFIISPDSFIINNQLNLTPIHDIYGYLWDDTKSDIKSFPIRELDKLQLELSKLVTRLDIIDNEIDAINNKRSILEKEIHEAVKINSENRIKGDATLLSLIY